jgi:uncharacterized membrane protein
MADENVTNQAPEQEAPQPQAAPSPTPTPAAPQAEPEMKFDQKDIEDNKIVAALSYLGLLFLIPMLAKRESAFCQFHAKQGLVITVAGIVLSWIPFLGWLVGLALLVLDIIALVKTLSGEAWKVPFVYDLSKKINL